MHKFKILAMIIALISLSPLSAKIATDQNVTSFIDKMAKKHAFEKKYLFQIFEQADIKDSIINAMERPAEKKPWHVYRNIFISDRRINEGVSFWQQNRNILQAAEDKYGVPAEIIVAIIGVETSYGKNKGSYRVIDALSTLAFAYPKRASYFIKELEQFFLLSREENKDILSFKGSYAGAMGHPQFMPSSYRSYAVDFTHDGKKDLIDNTSDAIGSVANYLKRHGWQKNAHIVSPVQVVKGQEKTVTGTKQHSLKPKISLATWHKKGVRFNEKVTTNQEQALLIDLEQKDRHDYWLGFNNFYVITTYNHSPLYAMAVYELSQKILTKRANS